MDLKNKTALITGASRGIGKAIAIKLASEGANVVIAAKSVTEQPRLEGTIYSAADEINKLGQGEALALPLDVRDENAIRETVEKAAAHFGTIDILVNNASAINLSRTEQIEAKRFDLMHQINVRGTLLMSKACIPFLKKSPNAHILNLSPPLNLDIKWFAGHLPYTLTKYNMSMIALGLSGELKKYNIGVNALWPQTIIATAAVQNLLGGEMMIRRSRIPAIVAEAAFHILQKPASECTGNFFIDEEVLRAEGVTDFERFAVVPGGELMSDLFLES